MNEMDIGPTPLQVAVFRAERSLMEFSTDVDYLDCYNEFVLSGGSPGEDQPALISVTLKDDAHMQGKEYLLISAKKFLIKEFEEQNLSVNKLRFAKVVLTYGEKFG